MLCGKDRDRTQNLGIPSPALCQLCYKPGSYNIICSHGRIRFAAPSAACLQQNSCRLQVNQLRIIMVGSSAFFLSLCGVLQNENTKLKSTMTLQADKLASLKCSWQSNNLKGTFHQLSSVGAGRNQTHAVPVRVTGDPATSLAQLCEGSCDNDSTHGKIIFTHVYWALFFSKSSPQPLAG